LQQHLLEARHFRPLITKLLPEEHLEALNLVVEEVRVEEKQGYCLYLLDQLTQLPLVVVVRL
jgi:hypothetical protein